MIHQNPERFINIHSAISDRILDRQTNRILFICMIKTLFLVDFHLSYFYLLITFYLYLNISSWPVHGYDLWFLWGDRGGV